MLPNRTGDHRAPRLARRPGRTYFAGHPTAAKRGEKGLRVTIANDIVDAIGRTPLIKLRRASEATGCTILAKAEFMNPGQSVKDRAALYIIQDAVRRGDLRPGGTIVEGTAGNTGIGLAVVANALGFRTVIVIPDTQSQEKKDTLRLLGAELVEVPAVPYRNPNNYVKYSGRLAAALARSEPNGAIWANQFDNTANRDAHIATTAREIWADTGGRVDGFVSAVGSGGTLVGTAMGLREKRRDIQIFKFPPGSCFFEKQVAIVIALSFSLDQSLFQSNALTFEFSYLSLQSFSFGGAIR